MSFMRLWKNCYWATSTLSITYFEEIRKHHTYAFVHRMHAYPTWKKKVRRQFHWKRSGSEIYLANMLAISECFNYLFCSIFVVFWVSYSNFVFCNFSKMDMDIKANGHTTFDDFNSSWMLSAQTTLLRAKRIF